MARRKKSADVTLPLYWKGPDCTRPIDPLPHSPKASIDGRYFRCATCGRYISKIASVGFLGAPLGIQAEPVFLFGLDTPPAQPRRRKKVDAMKEKWGKVAPV